MANNTLNARIAFCCKTASEWQTDTTIILKGELCIESDTRKFKFGVGTLPYKDLDYPTYTPEEINTLINQIVAESAHTHSNKGILDAITASFTIELLEKLNNIEAGANKTIVDSALSSTSTNPAQNKIIKEALDGKVPITRTINGHSLAENITLDYDDVGAIPQTAKGAANGVAELDSSGKIPSTQLPSYVDDVIEGYYNETDGKFYKTSSYTTGIVGESDKIYVDLNSERTFRWSGTIFVEISKGLTLGETESTAYRGDRGKIAYDHSQSSHAPVNAERNIIVGIQKNGVDISVDTTTRKANIIIPTKLSEFTNDSGYLTSSGTIAKANQLTNSRAIDGVNFNGTADINHYGTCSTAAATAAKTVALTGFTLVAGARVQVKFTVTNTASSPTLNVNSTGAKAIMYRGSAITAGYLAANRVYEFVYDGTNWELIGDINTDHTYTADTGIKLNGSTFQHTNSVTAGTAKGSDTKTLGFGSTFDIPTVTYDAQGHITQKGTTTMTMPAAPTTITGNAGSADKWKTARNFSIGGAVTANAVAVDGTKDIVLNATKVNAVNLYLNSGDTLILDGNF